MRIFSVGTNLLVDGKRYRIIGYIVYANSENNNETWVEYRMLSKWDEETWLSVDYDNDEFSLSWPTRIENGLIGEEWHKVDEGTAIVKSFEGDVDVDVGEKAEFIEHEDEEEEKILSVEMWEDGTEFSEGFYVDEDEISRLDEFNDEVKDGKITLKGCGSLAKSCSGCFVAVVALVFLITSFFTSLFSSGSCHDYISQSIDYTYVTSVTGSEDLKADVYEAKGDINSENIRDVMSMEAEMQALNELHADPSQTKADPLMGYYVKDLIVHSGIKPQYVTEDSETGESIAILTEDESVLFYHPEDNPEKIYVQVSGRKYNYTSNVRPYAAGVATGLWYRNHYYNTGYVSDSTRWSSTPSSYEMYNGPVMKNLGNGYYDVYSNDIRQSSAGMSRRSSSGGHSAGK